MESDSARSGRSSSGTTVSARSASAAGRAAKSASARRSAKPASARAAVAHETLIGRSAEASGDKRKFLGEIIVIDSGGEIRRDAETAVAFVEIAGALHVDPIGCEGAVIVSTRSLAAAGAAPLAELIAGSHPLEAAAGICGVLESMGAVNGKTVRRPSQQDHLG